MIRSPVDSAGMQALLYWTRVLYGLLSLPFAVFTLPLLFEALTNARPTAYDQRGVCVRTMTTGERSLKLKAERVARTRASVSRLSTRYGRGSQADSGLPVTVTGTADGREDESSSAPDALPPSNNSPYSMV